MRTVYEKYYTAQLICDLDPHCSPDIIDLPGEFDTEREARNYAEKEQHKYDWTHPRTGEIINFYHIRINPNYSAI